MEQTTNNKCKKCIFYHLCVQPDYIVDDITINVCGEYEGGIPKEIWDGKKECDEYFENIEEDENAI